MEALPIKHLKQPKDNAIPLFYWISNNKTANSIKNTLLMILNVANTMINGTKI